MKKMLMFVLLVALLATIPPTGSFANGPAIQLGDDLLFSRFFHLIEGKRVGLVTNQTGVNSKGVSTITLLSQTPNVSLRALYAPVHGLDGNTPAGQHVPSTTHSSLPIPVYTLDEQTRMPTAEMLDGIDALVIDLQDIGARPSPYLSALHDCMKAAKQEGKPVIVLDRPNPLGGMIVEGPVAEDSFLSFVGVDNLPLAHGMTTGELAQFLNRKIGTELVVVPMQGYTRSMTFSDTGLSWVATSPDMPTLEAVQGFMATGLWDGTAIYQADHFSWIGGAGIDSQQYANLLNFSNLPGVIFTPETRGTDGGVRLTVFDPRLFNPAKTGIYALAFAHSLTSFEVPTSGQEIAMFDKRMGTNKIGMYLENKLHPEAITALYADQLISFLEQRKPFLIYGNEPYPAEEPIYNQPVIPASAKPQPTEEKPQPAVPKPQTEQTQSPTESPQPQTEQPKLQPPTPPTDTKPGTQPGGEQAPNPAPVPTTPAPAKPAAPPTKPAGQTPAKPPAKVAYLTFDDGPSPITAQVLDILKEHNVKATFFIVGRNVKGNEKLLQRAHEEGHAIGGHTYSHNYKTLYRSSTAFFQDLEQGNKAIKDAIGVEPTVFRYPGGSTNTVSLKYQDPAHYNKTNTVMADIKKQARERGYHFIDWNVSNGDASTNNYTAESAVQRVKEQTQNKREAVILMHDAAPKKATAQSLPAIIAHLKAQGYTFQTLTKETPSVSYVK